jgi:hypothetical protein
VNSSSFHASARQPYEIFHFLSSFQRIIMKSSPETSSLALTKNFENEKKTKQMR